MAITRPNALTNASALTKYCDGVKKLKNEFEEEANDGSSTESDGARAPPKLSSVVKLSPRLRL